MIFVECLTNRNNNYCSELYWPEVFHSENGCSKSCIFAHPSLTGHDREYQLRRWSRCPQKPTSLSCSVLSDLPSPVAPCCSPPLCQISLISSFSLLSPSTFHHSAWSLPCPTPPRILLDSAQKSQNSLWLPPIVLHPICYTGLLAYLSPLLGGETMEAGAASH